MNKSAGFTLMETLVSLTIVCFMTMLPTLAIHRWQETLKIEQFLATVEKQLRFAQQQAIVLEETQEVWFFEEQQSFSFPDKLNQSARRTLNFRWGVVERLYINGFECFCHRFTTNHKFSISLSIISAVSFSSSFSTSL
ncbi:MAG: prepilin-type N-terminal cleavage/methylation domain-containing protein [Enterococcus faecalis]|nr:prepilin-type N-terminal cleavage/methylation domain-containing protein [Enterococcus faecalis]